MDIETLLENAPKEIKSERICLPVEPKIYEDYVELGNELRKDKKLHVLTDEIRRRVREAIDEIRVAYDSKKKA